MTTNAEKFAIGQRVHITRGHSLAPTGTNGTLVQSKRTFVADVEGEAYDADGDYWAQMDVWGADEYPVCIGKPGRNFEPLAEDTAA